jgi:tetratricopeptide (TPR) repeat protein
MSITPRIEQIRSMLLKEPKDAFLLYALATEYVAGDELEEARSIFEDLVENQANYVATYYHLGKLYERIGLSEKAEKTYEKGIKVATDLKDMHARAELLEVLNSLLYDD